MPDSGQRTDPWLGFRFEVRLDDLGVGGFSVVAGLHLEVEVQDHPVGGMNAFVR
jgi:hypothetical protein